MTSTPRDSTGKNPRSRDWCIRYLPETDDISPVALSVLKCPFNTIPKPKDTVPTKFTEKVRHLQGGQSGAPYTGYYAVLNNALLSVSNMYGVWFEVRLRDNKFECFRLARSELELKNYPLTGIDLERLEASGLPTRPPTRPPSRTENQPTEEQPRESGSGMFSTEQLTKMFSATSKEKEERAPTPDDDPSSDEDKGPKDKDPFGSFGIRSS